MGVPNSGLRLFGRIRIRIGLALPAEHFYAAPAVLIFTTSLCPSLITAVPACCLLLLLAIFHIPGCRQSLVVVVVVVVKSESDIT